MRFIESLPVGLPKNARWQVTAPEGGIQEDVNALIDRRIQAIDLDVRRDDESARIHVIPHPETWVQTDDLRANTYHLFNALAIFLDLDGEETENQAMAHVVIQTEIVPVDMSAGHVVMEPPESADFDSLIATAS